MNLYLISQDVNDNYDTFDSAIICAASEWKARMTHPQECSNPWDGRDEDYSSWCAVNNVKAELIGVAGEGVEAGVVLSSFNAG